MKGLFIKDFRLMKSQKNSLILFFFMFLIFWLTGMDAIFFLGYVPFLCLTIAMSTLSMDELDNGMAFLLVLPVSRKAYVTEKYLLGGLLGVGGFLAAFVLFAISNQKDGVSMTVPGYLGIAIGFLAFVVLFLCLMIPVQLKLGTEKGRLALFGVFFCIIGLVYLAGKFMESHLATASGFSRLILRIPLGGMLALAAAFFVLVIFISVKISLGIMKKKEW